MARLRTIDMSAWPSLALEGNLIAPAMIARIDRRAASEQTEDSYGIRKGLTIREEISLAFRVGQAHFDAFAKLSEPSQNATRKFVRSFLTETFGFDDLVDASSVVSFVAGHRVPVVIVPPSETLDRRSPTLSVNRSRSPSIALQDHLNEHDGALWGLATNGTSLRLMRDNASLTRPAHIEADLEQIFRNEDAASFAVLWLLIHRSRFGKAGTPAPDCSLERWRDTGAREGETARDRLAGQVETALRVLGTGFLQANPDLAERLRTDELPLTTWFNDLLRLVYRLIFLMVAEDRDLLHPTKARSGARKLYANGYSLTALRAQCVRGATWDRHHDRYEGTKIVFRALATGEDALGLPALGGLFSLDRPPSLQDARLRNNAFMEAIYRLSWLSDRSGMVPVNWSAMETEELGSVYESLLELQPQLSDDGRSLAFASDVTEQKGNQRKTTGSYYTPDSLVQALLDTALDPVLDRIEEEAEHPEDALLGLSVIDPACGSGHFLLAAARRIATRVARIRAEGTPSLADYRHALRDSVRNCIYGVDLNPMAVDLTRVALWIETVDPGLPLGFLDAQVRCGNALLGVYDLGVLEQGIPKDAYKPLSGDDKEVARYYMKKNKSEHSERAHIEKGFRFGRQRDLMRDFAAMRAMPEDTLAEIATKSKRLKALTESGTDSWLLSRACDLYMAAFLAPKVKKVSTDGLTLPPRPGAEDVPTTGTLWEFLRGGQPSAQLVQNTEETMADVWSFHWPLEFPDIMAGGGFDVVIGNPPWERIKLQEQEFFAIRSPEIAGAPNAAARSRRIADLAIAPEDSPERALHATFVTAKRRSEASSLFLRVSVEDGGRFAMTGRGDVNTYSLFAELFSNLAHKRAGVIVPTGIATDATTAPFFAALVEKRRLAKLADFENRAGLFPAVDSRMKFCLLTLGKDQEIAEFAFFLTDPAQLVDSERNFTLNTEQIAAINPNTRTAPVFRSRADAALTAKIYSKAPVLIDESKGPEGNPWGISFATLFHMSNDSSLFRTARQLSKAGYERDGSDWVRSENVATQHLLQIEGMDSDSLLSGEEDRPTRYVPLFEAKMIHQLDHRWAGYDEDGLKTMTADHTKKREPCFEPSPRYWVPKQEVDNRLDAKGWTRRWLMGWRDIARATDERTVISTVIPRKGVGDKFLLMLCGPVTKIHPLAGLGANLSALPLDFAARQKVGGTNLKFFIFRQLPALPTEFYNRLRIAYVLPRFLELTYTSFALTAFARDLGYKGSPFTWDEGRRMHLRAELDAFFARAYGLTRDELRYILDPADAMGPNYPSETFRVLKNNEIRRFGEYRTRRLVLSAWDRMEASGEFIELGL